MIEFGKTLRAAREAKGYTITQLSEITHLAPTSIEDLENENFSRIAAPIYGRGFVKLYCAAVDLEAKPMIDEFMDIFLGNRATSIREIPDDRDREPVKTEDPPAVEPPAASDTRTIIQPTLDSTPQQIPAPEVIQPEPEVVQPDTEPVISRYATPLRTSNEFRISPSIWRMAILSIVGLTFLILLCLGIRALYRATNSRAQDVSESHLPPPEQELTSAPPATTPRAPRTPIGIPPLYVD